MSTEERYNGWANRETWAVALHINNDQGWQESVQEALRAAIESATAEHAAQGEEDPTYNAIGRYRAGEIIRENVESLITVDGYRETFGDQFPESLARVAEDIGSLYRVDWTELGAAFLEDIAEQD